MKVEQRVTKQDMNNWQVIGQLDRKFILVCNRQTPSKDNLLILDQHAVHERIQLEALIDSHEGQMSGGELEALKTKACRSAIMFGDALTRAECVVLVYKLSSCRFPFQCAHGRPSIVPLHSFHNKNAHSAMLFKSS